MPYNTSSLNRVGNDFDFNPGGGTQVRFGEADYSEGTDMWATQVRVRDRYIHGWVPTQERESQRVWRFAESTQGWTPLNQADLSIASSDRAAVINELQAGDYRIVSPHSMDINPANYSSFQMRFRQTVPAVGGAPLWDGSVFWREAAAGTGNFTVADSFQFAEPAGFASGDWCHIKHTFNFADTWIYPSLTAYVDQLALRFFQYPINAHPSSYPQYEIAWIALDKTSTAIEERMTSALWDRTAYPAGAIELYDSSSVELAELPQNLSSQEDVRWMDRIVNGWDSGFGNILTYINGISPDESRYLFGEPHITVPKESPVGESEDTSLPLSVRVYSSEQASPPNLVLRARTPGIGTSNEPSVYVYAKAEKASYEFKFGYFTRGDDPQWDGITGSPRSPEDLLEVGMQIGLQYSLEPGGICYGVVTDIERVHNSLPAPYNTSIGGEGGIITCRWSGGVTPQQTGVNASTGIYHWPRYFDVSNAGDYFEPTVDVDFGANSNVVRGQFVLRSGTAAAEQDGFINIDPILGSGLTWELFSVLQDLTPLGNSARVLYAPTGTTVDFGFQKLLISWDKDSRYKHWIDVNDS